MTLFVLFLFLHLFACSLTVNSNQKARLLQSITRTDTVVKMCADYSTRQSLVDDQSKADADTNSASLKASLGLSGNQIITRILSNPSGFAPGALAEMSKAIAQLSLIAGPFVLGFGLILLVTPYLVCCFCCPTYCPPKCCQKSEEEDYTKCEMVWPSVMIITALSVVILGSAMGISRASDIQSSYGSMGCSLALTLNDILYGNTSTSGKYFQGMRNIANSLLQFKSNLAAVNAQLSMIKLSNATSPITLAVNSGANLLNKISIIPNNAANGVMPAFGYKNFDNTGTTASVPSTFPSALGTTSGSKTGLVGTSWISLNTINQNIKAIGTSADTFIAAITSISASIDSLFNSTNNTATLVQGIDFQLRTGNDIAGPLMNAVTIATTIFFAVFMGFGFLGIFTSFMMTFCHKFSCRYLLYVICGLFFVLGSLCFLLGFVFSLITPAIYFSCDYLALTMSSKASFQANVGNVGGSQLTTYIGTCLAGGSGDILDQTQNIDLSPLYNFKGIVSNISNFQAAAVQAAVFVILSNIQTTINDYYYSKVYDFNSASNENILNKLADPTNYPTCTINSFAQDSWVTNLARCSSTSNQASAVNCPTSTQIRGGRIIGGTCYGCMDTFKILLNSGAGTTAQVGTDLNLRYNNLAGCGSWTNGMMNLWTAYYLQKKAAMTPILSRTSDVFTQYNTVTTGYKSRLSAMMTAFPPIATQLTNLVGTVIDPNYGMFAGTNCQIVGEDIQLISNTICVKLFNTFYFLRFTMGVTAFGVLFSIIFMTCLGVRNFKQSQKLLLRNMIKINEIDQSQQNDPDPGQMTADETNKIQIGPKI